MGDTLYIVISQISVRKKSITLLLTKKFNPPPTPLVVEPTKPSLNGDSRAGQYFKVEAL